MVTFTYRALTKAGELISGSIVAPSADEVGRRISYLGLVPIEAVVEQRGGSAAGSGLTAARPPRAEERTAFTRDLSLLLKAGARIDGALDLLATDIDVGRLRPTVEKVRSAVLAGESFGDALGHHPAVFSSMYVALVRIGETSGRLADILDVLATEQTNSEVLRRRLVDALRYPAFILFAAACVMGFFLTFVLPQFATLLRDLGAKLDPTVSFFIALSDFLRGNPVTITATLAAIAGGLWLVLRSRESRVALVAQLARLPLLRAMVEYHRTSVFCRNLGVLLGSGIALPVALSIISEAMAGSSDPAIWQRVADRVRHGSKLSDALSEAAVLPTMALRMLRLGEETSELPMLAGRVADFYEAKLGRNLDRVLGAVGPTAIILISVVVGGLIVSIMTSLLSVTQIIG